MGNLQVTIFSAFIISIVLFLITIIFFIAYIAKKKNISKIKQIKPRSKDERKEQRKILKNLTKSGKRILICSIIFFSLGLSACIGATWMTLISAR